VLSLNDGHARCFAKRPDLAFPHAAMIADRRHCNYDLEAPVREGATTVPHDRCGSNASIRARRNSRPAHSTMPPHARHGENVKGWKFDLKLAKHRNDQEHAALRYTPWRSSAFERRIANNIGSPTGWSA
jgi:hypothetical protein